MSHPSLEAWTSILKKIEWSGEDLSQSLILDNDEKELG